MRDMKYLKHILCVAIGAGIIPMFVGVPFAHAETHVPEQVISDVVTWDKAAGPYLLEGHVTITEGGSLVVLEVRPRAVSSTRAVLLVRDRRTAYSVLTPDGTTTVAARDPRWWRVTMALAAGPDGDAWRLADVAHVAAPAT